MRSRAGVSRGEPRAESPLRGGVAVRDGADGAAWYTIRMNEKAISALWEIFGERLKTSLEDRICYSYDATGKEFLPDAVAYPLSAEDVRRTMLLANEHRFPVVPRGAGSGFSGGSLPVRGGVVLSTERMDRILSIDTGNLVAVFQCTIAIDPEA